MLAKVTDLHKHGYAAVLAPLLRDVHILEQDGVFIERVGRNVKGTIFCVSADNLAAHGLSGFVESFKEGYVCRFCLATREQFKATEARQFSLRTKDSHDLHVQTIQERDTCSNHFGVKASCVLRDSLDYFHPITGFPPDVLHDLPEGIVPVELSLCIKTMIQMKYFTLECLNQKIASFPYQHADKVDRPQPIPKTFLSRGTIGGNRHENATLLRLLPLLVGSVVPEADGAWTVLMELKEVVHIMAAVSPQPMILRAVEPDQARKLKLSSRPASVDALIAVIKQQLKIDLDFSLKYEDPDFDGKLTFLSDIDELPQKAVVHVSFQQDSSSVA
ncbi:hypothetical protein QQF64_020015 [Cirrhinus molitorella]|uniref:Uncharacterized protein n=1 Tax=Cirrhinus molitorella TaxID=172907 RepID=A0ABR3LKE7_9TELE